MNQSFGVPIVTAQFVADDPQNILAYGTVSHHPVTTNFSHFPVLGRGTGLSKDHLQAANLFLSSLTDFPLGLRSAAKNTLLTFPTRIWILDNSGSMSEPDGHRIATSSTGQQKMIPCSRWEELCETVSAHIDLATGLRAPTSFRLLNCDHGCAQRFWVGRKEQESDEAKKIIKATGPSGYTPLTRHIKQIEAEIRAEAEQIRNSGEKIAVIIATDGLPSDDSGRTTRDSKRCFVEALNRLHGLPVWVVVRLLTDDENVVEYWGEMDSQLELPLEVIDDWQGEAAEVFEHNSWLTYGLPIHRLREMGSHHKVFDLLDERSLSAGEMAIFVRLLLGCFGSAEPSVDWSLFESQLGSAVKVARQTWHPLRKRMAPWIDMRRLRKKYGKKSSICALQ